MNFGHVSLIPTQSDITYLNRSDNFPLQLISTVRDFRCRNFHTSFVMIFIVSRVSMLYIWSKVIKEQLWMLKWVFIWCYASRVLGSASSLMTENINWFCPLNSLVYRLSEHTAWHVHGDLVSSHHFLTWKTNARMEHVLGQD